MIFMQLSELTVHLYALRLYSGSGCNDVCLVMRKQCGRDNILCFHFNSLPPVSIPVWVNIYKVHLRFSTALWHWWVQMWEHTQTNMQREMQLWNEMKYFGTYKLFIFLCIAENELIISC